MRHVLVLVAAFTSVILFGPRTSIAIGQGLTCYRCQDMGGGGTGCNSTAGITSQCGGGCDSNGCSCSLSGMVCSECCVAAADIAPDGRAWPTSVANALLSSDSDESDSGSERTCK